MNNPFLTASPEMAVEVLYSEPIEVLMASHHPLAQYQQLQVSELASYPQIMFKDGYGMQRLVQDWFSRHNARLHSVMELNTPDAFRSVVRQGDWIALLPTSALSEAKSDSSLAIRPIAQAPDSAQEKDLTRQVVLATTRDRLQIPPIQSFCQLVRQLTKSPNSSSNSQNNQVARIHAS